MVAHPQTMRAIRVHRPGGPEVLEIVEAHRYMEENRGSGKLVVLVDG